jgi:superfamily II DNA or RNA helicase
VEKPTDRASSRAEILASFHELRAENERLRRRIQELEFATGARTPSVWDAHDVPLAGDEVTSESSPESKLGLYQSLFRGRDDVYAVRWERGDGRSGYAPALRSGARRGRGVKHDAEDYLRLTPQVIRSHLTGESTIGIYPLLGDETCWLLAIDFDNEEWQKDVLAVAAACELLGIPAAVERSRSGAGAHLWIFFASPVAASLARSLGSIVLTKALDRRHQIGLDSYDRLFPSQDTLPHGRFGNLIALPLQGERRRHGNTLFLDQTLQPHADQWRFLASIRRLEPMRAESIVRASRAVGVLGTISDWFDSDEEDKQPWKPPSLRHQVAVPFPGLLLSSVTIVLANRLFVTKDGLPPLLINQLRRLAAFQNPEFYRAQAMRMSTFGKPRLIDCSEDLSEHVALPRGCLPEARRLLERNALSVDMHDERCQGTPIGLKFQGNLSPRQADAAAALARHEFGVLSAPTAFGKTVIGAWLIAERGVSTLILVHRQHLLDQWRERLATFLDSPLKAIGQIGGGKRRPTGIVDVALLQSLSRQGEVDDVVTGYGQVIVDECHHVPAFNFERVLAEARAKFVVGLTATPKRKDGHHPIIAMQCGPIRVKVNAKEQAATRPFEHEVVVRATTYRLPEHLVDAGIQEIYSQLIADESRTSLIIADVLDAIAGGRSPLVLTERREHLDDLANRLTSHVPHVLVLKGGMGARQRKQLVDRLAAVPTDEPRVLLATGRYIGEGFDDARLDTLFLTLPVSWRGTIHQYAGRLHRTHAGKQLVQVFDYVDIHVPVLLRMLRKRIAGYEEIGYAVRWGSQEPASLRSHAEPLDTSTAKPSAFTPLQGQYLSFMTMYSALNRRPPAEADIQHYFKVTPPTVHNMIVALERRGLIRRTPEQARAIEVLVPREQLPTLAEPAERI